MSGRSALVSCRKDEPWALMIGLSSAEVVGSLRGRSSWSGGGQSQWV